MKESINIAYFFDAKISDIFYGVIGSRDTLISAGTAQPDRSGTTLAPKTYQNDSICAVMIRGVA